ncbi:MAG TPA: flagellar hook-basal body complex protein FliE [Nitrospiraceae bacterium]|nr:MAG: flagellar hook-basal body complex protein FliE [Nitrospirae bacterium GWA2_46_11]OGW23133.1 MAG: flagellar hook-basal body complex protein FliE [Nitrospirae bacterium GWB2_47_37]HAK87680.1 flagellar hook-basal body complex protein FliE [Nitrospiraceae bacterium]HCZ12396.1 flagellar hook-basal body complex protein FliE [Nitrospiraceae bacterium]
MDGIKKIGEITQGVSKAAQAGGKTNSSFEAAINDALKEVSQIQNDAEKAIEDFSKGEVKDIHTVVIAMEKADMSLQTMLQVRNKLLTAYEEITRMQV